MATTCSKGQGCTDQIRHALWNYSTMTDEPDTVEMELPYWMVKQLRGCAMQSKHESRTEYGREDAQKIISLLTYYMEEATESTRD